MLAGTDIFIPAFGEIALETLPYTLESLASLGFENVRVLRERDVCTSAPFSRSKIGNLAATLAGEWFALCDADFICTPKFAEEGSRHLSGNPGDAVLPRINYLNRHESQDYREKRSLPEDIAHRRTYEACGGFLWVRTKDFIESGGLNTDFVGWGHEEFEFVWRWESQGRRVFRPDARTYHLHHERTPRKADGYYASAEANMKLLNRLKAENQFNRAFDPSGAKLLIRDGGGNSR